MYNKKIFLPTYYVCVFFFYRMRHIVFFGAWLYSVQCHNFIFQGRKVIFNEEAEKKQKEFEKSNSCMQKR